MNTALLFKSTAKAASLQNSPTPRRPLVAPSLRLRVTAANRPLLRWLRSAEMEAWEESIPTARRTFSRFNR